MRTDHLAFVGGETSTTHDFYTRVLQWPLVGAHTGTEPDGRRFFITAFDAGAFKLEFEEVEDREPPSPQAPAFPHLGIELPDAAALRAFIDHLDECAVAHLDVSESESFVTDPNGLTFQFFIPAPRPQSTEDRESRAQEMVDNWIRDHQ